MLNEALMVRLKLSLINLFQAVVSIEFKNVPEIILLDIRFLKKSVTIHRNVSSVILSAFKLYLTPRAKKGTSLGLGTSQDLLLTSLTLQALSIIDSQ